MKTNMTLTIDTEVLIELRKRKINKSKVVNIYLRRFLEIADEEKQPDDLEELNTKLIKEEIKVDQIKEKMEEIERKKRKMIEHQRKRLIIPG